MAVLLGLFLVLFTVITWQVVDGGPLLRPDERLSHALVHPDRFAEFLSDLGGIQVAVPVLALVAGLVAWRGRACGVHRWWLPPAAAAVLMALLPALIVPLKDWTARPGTPAVPPGTGYFPSGHSATAAVAYGSAALLLLPWLRSPPARRLTLAACALVNLGVGYGLIRRGYHWPLDVVAGWCLSAVLLATLSVLLSRSTRRRSRVTPRSGGGPGSAATSSGAAGPARFRGSPTSRGSSSSPGSRGLW